MLATRLFRKPLFTGWSFLVVLVTASACADDNIIYSAVYKGDYSGWRIEMTRELVQTDTQNYRLRSYAKNTFATIDESSLFSMESNRLWPQHYAYKRKVFGNSSEEKIDFNWLSKTANYQRYSRRENVTLPVEAGILDPALYQLQMQRDFASGQKNLHYSFVKRKEIKRYSFTVTGNDQFTLNGNTYDAIIVERSDGSPTRKTRVWLLPDLDFQIARIQQKEESGDTYAIELTRYTADNAKLNNFYNIKRSAQAQP